MTLLSPTHQSEQQPPFRLRSSMNGMGEAPGKVWFFELAAAVIDADRCIQCGACIAACPSDSLATSFEDLPYLVKMCTGCSLCWDFCPRGGLRYEATWPKESEESEESSPLDAALSEAGTLTGESGVGLGVVVSQVAAKVRDSSPMKVDTAQDGGVVSAILIAALEAGEIDGALVARENPATPWRGVPFIATTTEELLERAGSYYNQTLALGALDLERFGLADDARIAIVGTPCEIQGLRALQARSWRTGNSRIEAVTLAIALMCTKSFDYRKLMLRMVQGERRIQLSNVGKVDVVHGRFQVFSHNGDVMIDEPVKNFHGAALKGCDECADFLGRGADISVGSVGSEEGYSSVLVRTEVGEAALARVIDQLEVVELDRPEALARLDQLDKKIALGALERRLEPSGPLFIDFEEHLSNYEGTDRAPNWLGR
jgi:coenzyme F420 hydrogenase subunit beta